MKNSMSERSEFTIFSFKIEINNKYLYWKSSKIIFQLEVILFLIDNTVHLRYSKYI